MSYKKKRGRKKKRGPKKKKPAHVNTYVGLKRPYHIITANNGVQIEDVYSAVTVKKAIEKMMQLKKEYSSGVEFPVKYISSRKEKTFTEARYSLIVIKKREESDPKIGIARDESGIMVEYETDNDKWLFIDETEYLVEEKFWVYGYNPKTDRKDYRFIFDKIIKSYHGDKYHMKQIVVFKNKLLVGMVDRTEIILCKNKSDAIRLYNKIEQEVKDKGMKYVFFNGEITRKSYSFRSWYDRMVNTTNWTYRKIMKNTTRD